MRKAVLGSIRAALLVAWLLVMTWLGPEASQGGVHALRPAHLRRRLKKATKIEGPIKTIVVLVMENRSFDHMLGWMKKLNPEIDGVIGNESNPLSLSDPHSPRIYFSDTAEFVDPDPGHSFQAIRQQIFGANGLDDGLTPPPMSGFAAQAESILTNLSHKVMSGFRPEVVPIYTALMQEFAICDRWFAANPASTQPNRLFIHSATSHGATSNVRATLEAGYPQRTIFDSIHDAGLSFRVYYQNIPTVLFYKNLRKLRYINNFRPYGTSFKHDAGAGKLANYVVIEQRYFDVLGQAANDDHPSHDVSEGQKLIKEVYEILRASPQWNELLFVITYDEHGGFYDHVPTPVQSVPSPDKIIGPPPFNFTFHRLGVRVPAFFISPWINKGTVLHEPNGPASSSQFEHSSMPATVKKLFNLPSDFLTERDAWAGTFDSLVSERTSPRTDCPEELPSPPWSLRHGSTNDNRTTSEFQQELVELAAAIGAIFGHQQVLNVKEANDFVEDAMSRFMAAGKAALDASMDESTIIKP
ncbi:hypothetical protein GOP47_0020563 [Adiantum capillus-veneris]|uniref:Uncharacterized protein n=1 Tax=Adiantum capillus-veneris TaxID=13818 RepID=A0A9D4Z671_ADICA|nr:hypothetical protein GOP47_0020563 [Adiantum capillus-veneris]